MRRCDLPNVLTDLDLGNDLTVVILHGDKLIDAAEDRLALGGDHPLADAESVDLGVLQPKIPDQILVERVGYGDLAALPTGFVQHLTGLAREIGKVAGVKTDAALGHAHGL